jgi:hypothetical protein
MNEQEDIIIEFVEEFGACVEIEEFFKRNLPTDAPDHDAGEIVLWTSARSHRTFKVMVKDCKLGYALEAAKLNRALFEDMVCAHWAERFSEKARKLIVEHGQYTEVLRAELYAKHSIKYPGPTPLTLTQQQREALDARYQHGSRSWTGKGVSDIVDNIVGLWPQQDRRLLIQMHDIAHRANNVMLHHSAASLSQGVTNTGDGYRFDVGPSPRGVSSALRFGFWVYANTISLVLTGDVLVELNTLVSRYSHLFSTVRSAGEGD